MHSIAPIKSDFYGYVNSNTFTELDIFVFHGHFIE